MVLTGSLCANTDETTTSERLVYNRVRGRGGLCLIAGTLGTRSASVGTCFCPTWDSLWDSGDSFKVCGDLLWVNRDKFWV
jgi:hypothetical protein